MAHSITFQSLRAGENDAPFVVNIGTGSTGSTIPLKGGAEPFVTQEDDTEDVFAPVRTQSGYLRIVDDRKDAAGSAFDWQDLIPATDTSIPVTLTRGGTIYWQGFMQAQTFSGEINAPQEREYPVQCALSALASIQMPTSAPGSGSSNLQSFAFLLYHILYTTLNGNGVTFNHFVFQGGNNALVWLMKIVDWNNFVNITDESVTSKYTMLDVLEDICRFWGWTCRTWRDTVIFTCADDDELTTAAVLTPAQLATVAGGTPAGTSETMYTSVSSIDDYFASIDNNNSVLRGVSKATVTADCNQTKGLVEFAPQSVRDEMEEGGYSWYQTGEEPLVGFFHTTPPISSFTSQFLIGSGSFDRRQIYSDVTSDAPVIADCIRMTAYNNGSAQATLQTTHNRIYDGGSLRMSGTIYQGSNVVNPEEPYKGFYMRIGIGPDSQNIVWFYATIQAYPIRSYSMGWSSDSSNTFFAFPDMSAGAVDEGSGYHSELTIKNIPIGSAKYGKVWIQFLGTNDDDSGFGFAAFEIGNFKLEYIRDNSTVSSEGRERIYYKDRDTAHDYKAINANACSDEWSTDCIFASDNNMEYGYGLVINRDNTFMEVVSYGLTDERPEEHLANRVANYWTTSKHRADVELQTQAIGDISPRNMVTVAGVTGHPIAISHNWREDITKLAIIEM